MTTCVASGSRRSRPPEAKTASWAPMTGSSAVSTRKWRHRLPLQRVRRWGDQLGPKRRNRSTIPAWPRIAPMTISPAATSVPGKTIDSRSAAPAPIRHPSPTTVGRSGARPSRSQRLRPPGPVRAPPPRGRGRSPRARRRCPRAARQASRHRSSRSRSRARGTARRAPTARERPAPPSRPGRCRGSGRRFPGSGIST